MKSYGILSNPKGFHQILGDSMNPKGLLSISLRAYDPIGFYYQSLKSDILVLRDFNNNPYL